MEEENKISLIKLNVGGHCYMTTWKTLNSYSNLANNIASGTVGEISNDKCENDDHKLENNGTTPYLSCFINRNGKMFRYILNYMRNEELILPDNFKEYKALFEEALFFNLKDLSTQIKQKHLSTFPRVYKTLENGEKRSGYITLSYRVAFTSMPQSFVEGGFRKLNRISVCGKVCLCREVFQEMLNESRDPNCESDNKYTTRMFLNHCSLEHAFDRLAEKGFRLVCCNTAMPTVGTDHQSNSFEIEETRWNHQVEHVFVRD